MTEDERKKLYEKNIKPKKKGIRAGIGSVVLILFCSFLLVISTFLQLNLTHIILPMKMFTAKTLTVKDFLYTYQYIPQIPAVLFIVGLLGRRLGLTSILLYIITGLFVMPVFALGGGWRYIFEYGFGYILAYLPAGFLLGTILKKGGYTYKNTIKAVLYSVLLIHIFGLLYMGFLAIVHHSGWVFVQDWFVSQSGIKILYDFVLSYIAVLISKYARIVLWLYL